LLVPINVWVRRRADRCGINVPRLVVDVPGAGLIGGVVFSGAGIVCVAIDELGLPEEEPVMLCPAVVDRAVVVEPLVWLSLGEPDGLADVELLEVCAAASWANIPPNAIRNAANGAARMGSPFLAKQTGAAPWRPRPRS
jgi:hypothetical protein